MIALLNIPIFVRLVRSEVLALRDRPFVEAGRCISEIGSDLCVLPVRGAQRVFGAAAGTADLQELWRRLGVRRVQGKIAYDDSAALAEVRRAITQGPRGTSPGATRDGESVLDSPGMGSHEGRAAAPSAKSSGRY